MTLRIASTHTIAVAAALTFGMVGTAMAQGTAQNQTKIPVVKQSPGEVVPPKTDTVTVYRTDTTRIYSTDTVRTTMTVPGPTTTITRVDTVTLQPMIPPVVMHGGLYFGLGAGPSLPYGSISTVNNVAPSAQFQIGWMGLKNFIGVRADLNYARFDDNATYADLGPHPDVYNGSLDLKAQIPFLTHLFGMAPRFTVYALGGGTYTEYRNLRQELNPGEVGVGPENATINPDWQHHLGWNAGGGISFHWRSTELFAETRVISFTNDIAPASRQLPIMFGVDWY